MVEKHYGIPSNKDIKKYNNSENEDIEKFLNEYLIFNKPISIKNKVIKDNCEELINYLNMNICDRAGYKVNNDNIGLPNIIIPNIFMKIKTSFNNKKEEDNFYKNFLDNLKGEHYVLENDTYIDMEKFSENKKISEKVTFEKFCNGICFNINFNKSDINGKRITFNELTLTKRKIVFEAMLRLLNGNLLSKNEQKLLLAITLHLDDKLINMINNFNYNKVNPKIIEISNKNNMINNLLILLLNEIGFDIVIFNSKNILSIESKKDIAIFTLETNKSIKKSNTKNNPLIKVKNYVDIIGLITFILFSINFIYHLINRDCLIYSNNGNCHFYYICLIFTISILILRIFYSMNEDLDKMGILLLMFIIIIFQSIHINSIKKEINIYETKLNVNPSYVETISYFKDNTECFVTISKDFILYEDNLYGYIYHPTNYYSKITGNIYYNNEEVYKNFFLNKGFSLIKIPIRLTKEDIINDLPLEIVFDESLKVNANIIVVNSEIELNNLLEEYGINQEFLIVDFS